MKTYRIYVHPEKPRPVAVKAGFCWPAFLIGPLWFAVNRMWATFLVALVLIVGSHLYLGRASFAGALLTLAYFLIWLFIGFIANSILASDLLSEGYVHSTTVQAGSISKASDLAHYKDEAPQQDESATPL